MSEKPGIKLKREISIIITVLLFFLFTGVIYNHSYSSNHELSQMLESRNTGELIALANQNEESRLVKTTKKEEEKQSKTKQKETKTTDTELSTLKVHFIDVGQGDATLLICDDEAMLIDAGDNTKGTVVQSYLTKQGVKKLKYLVLTHPDADHIGGADVIVTKFAIDNVFMSGYTKTNKTYNELIEALNYKNYKWSTPSVGSTYTLGSATFTILAPNKNYSDPNNTSIALIVQNGNNRFLFTGDCEEAAEADILENGISIDCDVFKAGHHGSKASNTESFLKKATPEYVVVSCGEGNSYGHPHAGPMNSFRSMGMKLFRTDEQGSIIAEADGTKITWNASPTDSWTPGEPTGSSGSSTRMSSGSGSKQNRESGDAAQAQSIPQTKTQSASEQVSASEPAPTPEPAPQPTQNESAGSCWLAATGEKYHSINNCGRMNASKARQVTIQEAINMGYGKCSKCW